MFEVLAFAEVPIELSPLSPLVGGGQSITFRIKGEPETLDWNRAHSIIEAYILMNLMEGLVTFDSNLKAVPALAKSWQLSADRKSYLFRLRPGVLWSDGVPLKAKDFVYSWKRLLSPLTAAPYAYSLFDIVGAQDYNSGKIKDFEQVGVHALDDQTLQVTLNAPVAHWIFVPGFWVTFPLRQDVVEKYGEGWDSPGRMVNLGPYSLSSFDHNAKVTLKANAKYYGERGNVSKVTALIMKDDSEALSLYEQNKIDFLTELATADLKRLKTRSDLKAFPHLKTGYLAFVTSKTNLKVRRAIAMAIDKSKFNEILSGGQEPATSFVPPPLLGYSKTIGLPFYPKKARFELLHSGLDTTVPLKIEYLIPDWDKAQLIAETIQSELQKNLGIEVILKPYENKSYRTMLDLFAYPMFDYTWTADYPDPDNFLSVFQGDSGNSRTGWKNTEFDGMVQQARQVPDSKLRQDLYLQMQKVLLEDEVVIVPLYYEPNLVLVHSHVKSFELNPLDYLYLRKVNVVP